MILKVIIYFGGFSQFARVIDIICSGCVGVIRLLCRGRSTTPARPKHENIDQLFSKSPPVDRGRRRSDQSGSQCHTARPTTVPVMGMMMISAGCRQ